MFKNYLKIALRNLWRNKGYSAINIIGLAVGLATCLLFILYCCINFGYVFGRFAALPYDNLLIILIIHCGGYYFLGIHYSYNITPLVFDTFLFKLITYGINYPISQQTEVKMRH